MYGILRNHLIHKTVGVILLLLFLTLLACSDEAGVEAQAPTNESQIAEDATEEDNTISFTKQVQPIFADRCNTCHHPGNAVKVDLTNPFDPATGLINRPNSWTKSEKKLLVVPGDPEASALIWKVEQAILDDHVDGYPMPWHIEPLTQRQLDDLQKWIGAGAKDDALYNGSIAGIFGDGLSLGSKGGKCAYCHYEEANFGPDLTHPFNSGNGAVGVRADRGGIRISPGLPEKSVLYLRVQGADLPPTLSPAMPLHHRRLTQEEVQIIRDWILQGALDN